MLPQNYIFIQKLHTCNTLNIFLDNCHNERKEYAMIKSVEVICNWRASTVYKIAQHKVSQQQSRWRPPEWMSPWQRTTRGRQVRFCRTTGQTEVHAPHQATVLHDAGIPVRCAPGLVSLLMSSSSNSTGANVWLSHANLSQTTTCIHASPPEVEDMPMVLRRVGDSPSTAAGTAQFHHQFVFDGLHC